DSDRNGLVDCEDSTCREAGHCGPIEVDVCRPIDGDGCPVGYACYSSLGLARFDCVVPDETDTRDHGEACGPEGTISRDCQPGTICRGFACFRACSSQRECPPDSDCIFDSATENGVCTIACSYSLPMPGECAEGSECGPFQTLDALGPDAVDVALSSCFAAGSFVFGERELGDPCGSAVEERCTRGLLCVPDDSGVTACRQPCLVTIGTGAAQGCPGDGRCAPLLPTHPSVQDGDTLQGYCEP
ncbi:MAG: hypothetical protein AAGE52_13695, partial [Myxococcota bacterium]